MSLWKEYPASGAKISATAMTNVTAQPPATQSYELVNDAQQRERLLSAYTYSMEQLLQEQEKKDDHRGVKENHVVNGRIPDIEEDLGGGGGSGERTGCLGCLLRCLHSIDDDLIPYKLLFLFMRGGEACISIYLSVFGLQIGFTPLQLAFIYALPLLISAFTTPLCGFIADKFRCRKEMLMFALILWVFFSLTINAIPSPEVASCIFARRQFHDAVAKINLSTISMSKHSVSMLSSAGASGANGLLTRDFGDSNLACLVDRNESIDVQSDMLSWLSVLQVINTPWTDQTEECFPEGAFWEGVNVPAAIGTYGPKNTFRGWVFERNSLMNSFYAIFALLTVAMVMQGPTISLTDTATLHTLGKERSHSYGWQRAFGNAGFAIYITLVTVFIQMTSWSTTHCDIKIEVSDYRIAFVIFLGTTTCAIALLFAYCIKNAQNIPNESNIFNLRKVFCKPRPCLLLPILCFMAACEGAITLFLPFYLTTLGSPPLMIKGTRIINGVSELFLAFHLGQLIKQRGHELLLVVGTLGYLLCFLGYAVIPVPAGILAVEVIHGMSRALAWNVLVTRLSVEVHPENQASLQGFLSGFYMLGNGAGALVAGVGMTFYGGPITFFCFACACLLVGVIMCSCSSRHNQQTKSTKRNRYQPLPESESSDEG